MEYSAFWLFDQSLTRLITINSFIDEVLFFFLICIFIILQDLINRNSIMIVDRILPLQYKLAANCEAWVVYVVLVPIGQARPDFTLHCQKALSRLHSKKQMGSKLQETDISLSEPS